MFPRTSPVGLMCTTWLSERAISISVPTPLPLSTIPGPSITESRWAPIVTIRFGFPPGVSAITL
jgi:hypothetical protein